MGDRTLLIVLNPREIPECVEALQRIEADKAYVRYMPQRQAMSWVNRVIAQTGYARYVLTSDDVVVTQEALDAVVEASSPDRVSTGWCRLDEEHELVNLTKGPLTRDVPHIDAYDFYSYREARIAGEPIPTGFAGMGLTCIPKELLPALLPLECYALADGRGYSSDFHLSKKCERLGIPIVAPRKGFIRHVKERWNALDKAPEKRLLIGERDPRVTLITTKELHG